MLFVYLGIDMCFVLVLFVGLMKMLFGVGVCGLMVDVMIMYGVDFF